MTPPLLPKKLSVGGVVDHVREKYGLQVTRQTVDNWMKRGKNNVKLRHILLAGTKYTTIRWVDSFLTSINGRG